MSSRHNRAAQPQTKSISYFWRKVLRVGERRYDVALISDGRFPGGTSSSNTQEIKINHRAQLKTAFFHVPSPLIKNPKRPFSRQIQQCLNLRMAEAMDIDAVVYAPLTIIRHPTVVMNRELLPRWLKTSHVVVVLNHPPRWFTGEMHYDLNVINENIIAVFGKKPALRPNSPVISNACRQENRCDLEDCWYNVFDIPKDLKREISLGRSFTIGRHSRDSNDKWPESADVLRQIYPNIDGLKVAVLGGAETPRKILGSLPDNWDIYPFNGLSVDEFLQTLDVYVYFYHTSYTEAFARAPSEAIIRGIPTILPKTLQPLFQDACLYCEPHEVLSVIERLRREPDWYAEVAARGRKRMIERFGPAQHLARLKNLGLRVPNRALPD